MLRPKRNKPLLPLLFGIIIFSGLWKTSQAAEIQVRISNPPSNGYILFFLYDSPATFGDRREPVKHFSFPSNGQTLHRLTDIPPGEYALLVFHDERENGKLDENFIGIPNEPLAFSNEYRPKGPPSYEFAKFQIKEQELISFNVSLFKPLGKLGRIGVGAGVITQTTPYKQSDENIVQPFPAITYIGDRLQLFGPFGQFGMTSIGKFQLAVTARYRIRAYEDDTSPILNGMGDRKDTFMVGMGVNYDLPKGFGLSLRADHDVLDKIKGTSGTFGIDKSFFWKKFRYTPSLGVRWLSEEIANHDFGVPINKATALRPAYSIGDTTNLEIGLGTFWEVANNLGIILRIRAELLDQDITNSPIVDKKHLFNTFFALTYLI